MYNINRLNLIQNDMRDCLYKLERFKENYQLIKGNDELEIYLQESFRSYIRSYQELTIKLLAHTSKGLYTPKDKMKYEDIIDIHAKNNRLPNVDPEFLKELRFFRNEVAHGYEYPDFQAVYEFYEENKEKFMQVEECITLLIRNEQV